MFSERLTAPRLIAGILLLAVLYWGTPVWVPLVCAVFLYLLLDPVVEWAERYRIPRRASAPVAVAVAMILACGTGFAFYRSLARVAEQLPRYSAKIENFAERLHGKTSALQRSTEALLAGPEPVPTGSSVQKVQIVGAKSSSPITTYLLRGFNSMMALAGIVFFIPLISFFMLLEKRFLSERLSKLVADPELLKLAAREIREVSQRFFVGNFVLGAWMTLVFMAAFSFIKLEGGLELALFAGFLNLIPIFGSILGALLPAAQALLQYDGLGVMLAIFALSIVVHFVANNIVLPKFLGSRVNVNGTAAMIGFLVWGSLWGGMGLFLAIPLMAILRVILLTHERGIAFANLIAKTPLVTEPSPEEASAAPV